MAYLVLFSSEFTDLKIREFEGFEEAADFAKDYFEKGYTVEIIKVAQRFSPKVTEVQFEEVV